MQTAFPAATPIVAFSSSAASIVGGLLLVGLSIGLGLNASAQSQSVVGFQLFPVPTAGSIPHGITVGPDGALWFTEYATNKIGRITTAGTFTEYTVPTPNSQPENIVAGPDGNLWFTEPNAGQIGRITPGGTISEFSLPTPDSGPWGITAGPDGALWFTEFNGHSIGRITIYGLAVEFPLSMSSRPRGITTGPDGNLWFTDPLGSITPNGVITGYSIPPYVMAGTPDGITTGPDGNLWFTAHSQADSCVLGQITRSGAVGAFCYSASFDSGPGIATGPDGAMWHAIQSGAGMLGKLTRDTIEVSYPYPAVSQNHSYSVAAGPDGAIWFTGSYQKDPSAPATYVIGRATRLTVTPGSLPEARVGTPYSQLLALSGGVPPYTWSASGLPPGMSLSVGGLLNGTPTAAGAYAPQIMVQDSSTPAVSVYVGYTLDAEQLTLTPSSIPQGVLGGSYYAPLAVSGGTPPYTWTWTGRESGVDLSTGADSGTTAYLSSLTPPNLGTIGVYPAIIAVTDSSTPKLSASRSVTLSILGIGNLAPPDFDYQVRSGDPYAWILQPAGGDAALHLVGDRTSSRLLSFARWHPVRNAAFAGQLLVEGDHPGQFEAATRVYCRPQLLHHSAGACSYHDRVANSCLGIQLQRELECQRWNSPLQLVGDRAASRADAVQRRPLKWSAHGSRLFLPCNLYDQGQFLAFCLGKPGPPLRQSALDYPRPTGYFTARWHGRCSVPGGVAREHVDRRRLPAGRADVV